MQSRRDIADRVIARARARGLPIDTDPQILVLIDLWAEGGIEAVEMRRRYAMLLAERAEVSRARSTNWLTNAREVDRPVVPPDDAADSGDELDPELE